MCLSIAVNGVTDGYFSCFRGVRKRNLLYLLLFCIARDVLSRGSDHLVKEGRILPMSSL